MATVKQFANRALYSSGDFTRVIEYLNAHADTWTSARQIKIMFGVDDRAMRDLISHAVQCGIPMISGNSGYKIARSWEEARETVSRLESQAKKMLSRVRKTRDFFSEAARADMEADRERRKYNPAQLEIFAGAVNV